MNDYQIIGFDITNSEDFSVVVCVCGQCKTIITNRKYNPWINEVEVHFFIKCPKCGITLSHVWREDINWVTH